MIIYALHTYQSRPCYIPWACAAVSKVKIQFGAVLFGSTANKLGNGSSATQSWRAWIKGPHLGIYLSQVNRKPPNPWVFLNSDNSLMWVFWEMWPSAPSQLN